MLVDWVLVSMIFGGDASRTSEISGVDCCIGGGLGGPIRGMLMGMEGMLGIIPPGMLND